MSHKDYQYPFRENAKGTSIPDVYVQKGDELEKHIFNLHALPYIKKLKNKRRLIDIGSGEGRYSRYYGKGFRHIIAVEPDSLRYERTKKNLEELDAEVTCVHGTVSNLSEDEKADVIVNIHVLQHIHPSEADEILDFSEKALDPGGLLVLAFTKKTYLDNEWNIAWKHKGESKYTEVPKDVFLYISKKHLKGVLPVRKIKYEKIVKKLNKRNFSIKSSEEYAPRFNQDRHRIKGKLFKKIYLTLPPNYFHSLMKITKYPPFADVVVVAQKID